ncbi:MAG TPA: hypothetical protein ENG01_01500, partial [Candidatus Aenigmarchaeota archaeon]|nr:hypothetical protein [Candidatus Aenigmarchaeota archaeon]HEX33072.1 hypothetical protein [Candidatus Aenigmarchaeota archaeon]
MDICVFGAEKKGDKIVIYGRDRNGKKTVKEVDFNDYYYASPTSNKSRAYLKKHGKPVRKTLLGKEVEVYKVSSKIEVDDAERYCKEIPAPRKFILDNKIEPMHKNGKPMELKILAVDIEMYTPDMNLTSNKNPIIMVGLASENLRKVITWKNVNLEYVEVVKSEKEMLERFSEIVKEVDPDVIVGYNSDSFDFTHIKERARILKAKVDFSWDGRGIITKHKGAFVLGPVHVDLYQFIRNILSSNLKTDVYTLNAVCNELIGVGKKDMSAERMIEIWGSDENIDRIAEYNINDAEITYKLAKKILPIMMELVKLTSLPLFNVSRATYSTLVEELIIKEVWDKEVIPRKVFGSVVEDRYEKTYEGAFVYEPAPGVYENVAVFDFRSLYPSIIVTHNICPSTIGCKKNCYESPIGTKFRKRPEGFIPCILKRLIEERAEIKDRIKKEKDTTLESKQYALKILANSFYGYLGYPKSRWYSIECAKSITAWGRKYIQETLELISENGYKVLYADTDSAMFIH